MTLKMNVKLKVKISTPDNSASYKSQSFLTSSALQSRKWQLIGMSSALRCSQPLPALMGSWIRGADSIHNNHAPQSNVLGLYPYISNLFTVYSMRLESPPSQLQVQYSTTRVYTHYY